MSLSQLPNSVLLQVSNSYLHDDEARRLAQCSHACLQAMKPYRIKQIVPFYQYNSRWSLTEPDSEAATLQRFKFGVPTRVRSCWSKLPTSIPVTVRHVHFIDQINSLPNDAIPSNLLHGLISLSAFQADNIGSLLLKNLTSLRILHTIHWECPESSALPPNLTSLSCTVSSTLPKSLPASLRQLRLTLRPDQQLLVLDCSLLPSCLSVFEVWNEGQCPLARFAPGVGSIFPDSIMRLDFRFCDDVSLESVHLPSSLTSLALPCCPTSPLLHWNPPESLTELIIPWWSLPYSQLRLPPSLTAFRLPEYRGQQYNELHLPAALHTLQLCHSFLPGQLTFPSSLTALYIPFGWPCDLPYFVEEDGQDYLEDMFAQTPERFGPRCEEEVAQSCMWPLTLKNLRINARLKLPQLRDAWRTKSSSLIDLSLCNGAETMPMDDLLLLPSGLQRFTLFGLPEGAGERLHELLPASLTVLHIDTVGCALARLNLPQSLLELRLDAFLFSDPVENIPLPPHLQKLVLGDSFNNTVDGWALPASLTRLEFGVNGMASTFCVPLSALSLPDGLQYLSIPSFSYHPERSWLPSRIPCALQVLRVWSQRELDLSAWNDWIKLSDKCIVEFVIGESDCSRPRSYYYDPMMPSWARKIRDPQDHPLNEDAISYAYSEPLHSTQ